MATLMFLVPRISGGGAEKVIASLASQMAEKGHTVFLVSTLQEDGSLPYVFSEKVNYINLHTWETEQEAKNPPSKFERLVRKLKKIPFWRLLPPFMIRRTFVQGKESIQIKNLTALKRSLHIDCAVSFLNSANFLNVRSCTGERTVISVRSYPDGPWAPPDCRTREGRRKITEACAEADVIVPVSEEIGLCLVEHFGARKEKLRVIYNATDLAKIRAQASLPIENSALERALSQTKFAFLCAGRLTNKKGQWHVIRAFREVLKEYPNALLVLPGHEGKGNENVSDYLKQVIEKNNLAGHVLLPGFFENPYTIFRRCQVCVTASFNEGFPNVLVESMALGLPVIAADCSSGPRELLAPGTDCRQKTAEIEWAEYGVLVPPCSGKRLVTEPPEPEEQKLAEAMLRLMGNEKQMRKYQNRSMARAEQLQAEASIERWEQCWNNNTVRGR